MSVRFILKNSAQKFFNAANSDLDGGELAINWNESGPYLQCKASDGVIHQLGGVYNGETAPQNPLPGKFWLNESTQTLYIYGDDSWISIAGGGGGTPGPPGAAATVNIAATKTGPAGSDADVVNIGTENAAILEFTIPQGAKGDDGDSATVDVGTTTTGAPGTNASVTNSGDTSNAVFNFTIPQGQAGTPGSPGRAATVDVGSTTTGAPGTSANVTNSGTTEDAVFDFTIPRGEKGDDGTDGTSATVDVGTTTTGDAGTDASVTNSGTTSAAVFDFTIPKGDKGDKGTDGSDGTSATVDVGTTSTGAAGSSATVSNSGTTSDAVFNFTIPRGDKGDKGDPGTGITLKGTINYVGPPTDKPDPNDGDLWIDSNGDGWAWDGTTWDNVGPIQGPAGDAATITVGSTTTGAAGSDASVTNTGSSSAAVLEFTIPRGDKGNKGDTGGKGDKGDPGDPGSPGSPGTAATVDVGSTTTGAAGTAASVTNSGTTSAAVFNFTIPKGDKGNKGDAGTDGDSATVDVGTTTTGAAGTAASVVNSGTTQNAVFDFTIPKGDKGNKGNTGAKGDPGDAATVDVGTTTTGAAGTNASVTNTGTTSAAVFNFTIPKGDKGDPNDQANGVKATEYISGNRRLASFGSSLNPTDGEYTDLKWCGENQPQVNMTNGALTANQFKGIYLDRPTFLCPSNNYLGKIGVNNSNSSFTIGYTNGVSAGDFSSSNVMTFQAGTTSSNGFAWYLGGAGIDLNKAAMTLNGKGAAQMARSLRLGYGYGTTAATSTFDVSTADLDLKGNANITGIKLRPIFADDSAALTANKSHTGVRIDSDDQYSGASESTNGKRLTTYGLYLTHDIKTSYQAFGTRSNIQITQPLVAGGSNIYGVYGQGNGKLTAAQTGQTLNVYGVFGTASHSSGADDDINIATSNCYGVFGKANFTNTGSQKDGTMYGGYFEAEMNAVDKGFCDLVACYSLIDANTYGSNNAYLFKGAYSISTDAHPNEKWGLFLEGCDKSKVAGYIETDIHGFLTGDVYGNVEGNLTGTATTANNVKINSGASTSWRDIVWANAAGEAKTSTPLYVTTAGTDAIGVKPSAGAIRANRFQVNNGAVIYPGTQGGDYGNIYIDGSNKQGEWSGINLEGAAVFMRKSTTFGLYDDTNNVWAFKYIQDGAANVYFAGNAKVTTKTDGVTIAGECEAGSVDTGKVGLNNNDGYGNANVWFNHKGGEAQQDGSSYRIKASTDNNTASLVFQLASSVAGGSTPTMTSALTVNTTGVTALKFTGPLEGDVTGNVTGNLTGTADQADKILRTSTTSSANTNYRLLLGAPDNTTEYSSCYRVSDRSDLTYNPSTRAISGLTQINANATTATRIFCTARNDSTDTHYLAFVAGRTNNQNIYTDTGLSFQPSTDTIGANISGTAAQADTVKVNDAGFGSTGNRPIACFGGSKTPSGGYSSISYATANPPTIKGTGELTATAGFVGDVTGNVSGSSGSCTGNAATATKWKTARTLWGVSVDGSANKTGAMTGVNNITGANANMTIKPADSTTNRTIYLQGNSNTNGGGGNVVVGHQSRGSVYFRSINHYRFAKGGQTSIEGIHKYDLLTTDRSYNWPNQGGTVAMTSDIPSSDYAKYLSPTLSGTRNNQGLYVQWNVDVGTGATYFLNSKGSGDGGWRWESVTESDSRTTRMTLDESSNLSGLNKVTATTFEGKATDSAKLEGATKSNANTNNTIVQRNGSGDVVCRLVRSEYANQTSMGGAIAFRNNNSNDNYIRFCSSDDAARLWLKAAGYGNVNNWSAQQNFNQPIKMADGQRIYFKNTATSFRTGSDTFIFDHKNTRIWEVTNGAQYSNSAIKNATISGAAANLYINSTNGIILRMTSQRASKRNIKPMTEKAAFNLLNNLTPVSYSPRVDKAKKMNIGLDPNMKFYGLIAEDVEKVDPALVDHDNDGTPVGVHYSQLAVPLMVTCKAQQKKIEDLERRLAALEAK